MEFRLDSSDRQHVELIGSLIWGSPDAEKLILEFKNLCRTLATGYRDGRLGQYHVSYLDIMSSLFDFADGQEPHAVGEANSLQSKAISAQLGKIAAHPKKGTKEGRRLLPGYYAWLTRRDSAKAAGFHQLLSRSFPNGCYVDSNGNEQPVPAFRSIGSPSRRFDSPSEVESAWAVLYRKGFRTAKHRSQKNTLGNSVGSPLGLIRPEPVELDRKQTALEMKYSQKRTKYIPRDAEQEQLHRFIRSEEQFSWWQVSGAAGQGKSRLALEFVEHYADTENWEAGFLGTLNERALTRIENYTPNATSW